MAYAPCIIGLIWTKYNYETHPGDIPPLVRWMFELPLIIGMIVGWIFSVTTLVILIRESIKSRKAVLKSFVFWLSFFGLIPGAIFAFWLINLIWRIKTGTL